MTIKEALDRLGNFIDLLVDRDAISTPELEEIEAVESALHTYACAKGDM